MTLRKEDIYIPYVLNHEGGVGHVLMSPGDAALGHPESDAVGSEVAGHDARRA